MAERLLTKGAASPAMYPIPVRCLVEEQRDKHLLLGLRLESIMPALRIFNGMYSVRTSARYLFELATDTRWNKVTEQDT